MHPGTVTSDAQAFQQVLNRLESDVGTIARLVPAAKTGGHWPGTAPLWALVRMMFPVAESLADLICQKDNQTSQNLKQILEKEFEAARPGYVGKAAILAVLFRHSLTHTDELRSLTSAGREVVWRLSYGMTADHLKVTRPAPAIFELHFDTTAFYEDLVAVCRNALAVSWGGRVMQRYNTWLKLDLDAEPKPTATEKAAIAEIAAL
jgi:hypothetical protein